MSARRFDLLGAVAPDRLVDARLQLHHAAQLVASVGQTLLEPRPDDSQPNLGWVTPLGALSGHRVGGEGGFRAALAPAEARLLMLGAGDEVVAEYALEGRSLAEASQWLLRAVEERLDCELPSGLVSPGYELPAHDVAKGAPFTAERAARTEVARWLDAADAVLSELAVRTAGASEPRCWPHHFDLATLVTIETGADGDATKTVGLGLSPGDASYPEPYAYVSPWPHPDASVALPALGSGGHWHREGFTAAILTGSELVAGGPRETQPERLSAFLAHAFGASRSALGA